MQDDKTPQNNKAYDEIDGVKVPKAQKVEKESPMRSIMKAISWRVIASGTTFALALIFFGNDPDAVEKATYVAVIESVVKMLFYYLHERAWINIKWGKSWMRYGLIRRVKLNYIRRKRRRKHRKMQVS